MPFGFNNVLYEADIERVIGRKPGLKCLSALTTFCTEGDYWSDLGDWDVLNAFRL